MRLRPNTTVRQMMSGCGWDQADASSPMPLLPVAWFQDTSRSLAALHDIFWALRDRLLAMPG